ncbi:hypothetical protein DTO282E5_3834 [Paecilomyces variotii]|nr:hypothetical protein DTO282E5_3834 [Paecilomyces variotii]
MKDSSIAILFYSTADFPQFPQSPQSPRRARRSLHYAPWSPVPLIHSTQLPSNYIFDHGRYNLISLEAISLRFYDALGITYSILKKDRVPTYGETAS